MSVRLKAGVGLAALVAAATGGAVVGLAPAALAASAPNPWPAHVFAPYVDTWTGNVTLTDVAANTGTKFFTIAFIDGTNCQWQIGEQSTMQSQIDSLRAEGGDVSISFGGYGSDSALTELGDSCPTPEAAAAQIESVVTTFNVSHLDFDIEANSLTNGAGIDRRDKALAEVRSWASGVGRTLSISFTIPTNPSGLTGDGVNLLNNARANGFTPDIVNVMTMDYGGSGIEMGDAANQAMDALAGQVSSAFGISTSAAYAMLGNTPMIGQNDSGGEIFTLGDASSVESYAASRGIAMLSYWSENRDNGGCPGQSAAQGNCSGVSQNTGDFARTFQAFSGGGGCTSNCGGGGTGPGQVTGYQGLCLDVRGANSADGTPVQVYTCNGTNAQSWTLTSGNQLQALGKCLDVTGAGTANGTLVQLYTCNGTGAQVWQHQSNNEYTNPNSGKCLDDTGWGGSGTQVQIWDCGGGSNQQWSLP